MLALLRCYFRRRHNPVRHPLGGFRCADCGAVGADLEQMGFDGGGYVSLTRPIFDRRRHEITRGGEEAA